MALPAGRAYRKWREFAALHLSAILRPRLPFPGCILPPESARDWLLVSRGFPARPATAQFWWLPRQTLRDRWLESLPCSPEATAASGRMGRSFPTTMAPESARRARRENTAGDSPPRAA